MTYVKNEARIEKESDRRDQQLGRLGHEPSASDWNTYLTIHQHGNQPVSTRELQHELRDSSDCLELSPDAVWNRIANARQVLGSESIVKVHGGYVSRRAVIDADVERNITNPERRD
jgi:hypothetical protein